jgi:hypothetical protein
MDPPAIKGEAEFMPGFWRRISRILALRRSKREIDLLIERNRTLERYFRTSGKASEIATAVKNCNVLFHSLTNVKFVFREDIQAINALHAPCENERDFAFKIGGLAELFEVQLEPLRALLRGECDQSWRSIKLTEVWMKENAITYDPTIFEVWRRIVALRNASFPYHATDAEIVELLQYFDQTFPVEYASLCDSVLDKFLASLKLFEMALKTPPVSAC